MRGSSALVTTKYGPSFTGTKWHGAKCREEHVINHKSVLTFYNRRLSLRVTSKGLEKVESVVVI